MPTIKNKYQKLRRNETCPCEENMKMDKPLKYKQCCMKEVRNSEQQIRMLFHHDKRVAKAKKEMDAAIERDNQYAIDHPLVLPDNDLCVPDNSGSNIIIP